MKNTELVNEITRNMAIVLPEEISLDDLQVELASHINLLIQTDFQKLITLLYRIDVSEAGLKQLLKQRAGEHAGQIIATLIIERQLEKIKTRKQFSRRDESYTGEEPW